MLEPLSLDEQRRMAARDFTPPPSEADVTRERGALESGPAITMQPRRSTDSAEEAASALTSFPSTSNIATVEGSPWSASNINRYVPLSGLDYLVAADYVLLQQTIELIDLIANVESENRFLIKTREGETLFVAAESSDKYERQCCGSFRGFNMRIYDPNRQPTLLLTRPLAGSMCCCPCYLQEINVYDNNGRQLGRVFQEWTLIIPEFKIQDRTGSVIYTIQGPNCCSCCMYTEADFKIMSKDGLTQHGSIAHSMDTHLNTYIMGISFPSNINTETKGLIIAAAFLLEYMFFETTKTRSWRRFLKIRCC